jgi:hypothetical protein
LGGGRVFSKNLERLVSEIAKRELGLSWSDNPSSERSVIIKINCKNAICRDILALFENNAPR